MKIGHDGLLRSFASPFFNHRRDGYGASFAGRMRLSIEVLAAIREVTGGKCPIGVRLCLHEYTPFGYDLEYGLRMAEHLEASSFVDYFNSDAGSYSSFWMEIPPSAIPEGYFRPLTWELKKNSDLPIIAFGRIKSVDVAKQILDNDEADLIGMARQLIADPATVRKIMDGRAEEIRACIGCNDGCTHQVMQDKAIRCIQNPCAGQERSVFETRLPQVNVAKHVVVVGGGPAGMKAAEISSRRGHRVTLLERDRELGGQLRLAARQPYHEEIAEVSAYLEGALRRVNVDVWLEVSPTAQEVLALGPDVIVVATGSQPNLPDRVGRARRDRDAAARSRALGLQVIPEVRGLEGQSVYSTDEVLSGESLLEGHVLVIDESGHWEAAGTVEFLLKSGCRVTVVTRREVIAQDLEATNRATFLKRIADGGVSCVPLVEVRSIEEGVVQLGNVLTGETFTLVGIDAVVPVFSRRLRDDLYFELIGMLGEDQESVRVERIGDAAAPRLGAERDIGGSSLWGFGVGKMKICVCVKLLPKTDRFELDLESHLLMREGVGRISPPDLYALEEALRLRDRASEEVEIVLVSMSPHHMIEALRYGLAMGADRAGGRL